MEEDEYYNFLNDMDIAIFDMNRQQALGNIMAMVTFGKKVYCKKSFSFEPLFFCSESLYYL